MTFPDVNLNGGQAIALQRAFSSNTLYDERFRRKAITPIQNKLRQFLLNPVVRSILGQVEAK